MKKVAMIIVTGTLFVFASSCSSQQNTAEGKSSNKQNSRQNGPPTFTQLDTNNDGSLSKSEVKGPLANEFSKIDTDGNGVISNAEFENAPKPQGRPQGPPR